MRNMSAASSRVMGRTRRRGVWMENLAKGGMVTDEQVPIQALKECSISLEDVRTL